MCTIVCAFTFMFKYVNLTIFINHINPHLCDNGSCETMTRQHGRVPTRKEGSEDVGASVIGRKRIFTVTCTYICVHPYVRDDNTVPNSTIS